MFYDPIAVLQPIMINFKILVQQICHAKIQWDEEITSDLRQNWEKILNTLENIGKISITRNVVNQDLNDPIELIKSSCMALLMLAFKTTERPFTFDLFLKGVMFI